jgi:5'(3')-deoxyribonucleotidase
MNPASDLPARRRIAIDMDEVMADALSRHLDLYNRHYAAAYTREQMHGKYLHEIVPAEHQDQVHQWVREVGFFRDLPVMPDCVEVIRDLQQHYDIFITTAAMQFPNSFTEKYDWLAKHLPFIPWTHIVFCGDKNVIAADYLVDDHARNFAGFRGEGILFTAPHNVHVTGYRRVANWQEVRALFLEGEEAGPSRVY